ncbi:1-deoxy-D-xylulose-5-phosphate reductoisomerase [Bacillota bacterium LX-D]|nr:1-deoxy-D-xylulose-5-phosphate reductoisomerase [Bacillota bacterium LX-D]
MKKGIALLGSTGSIGCQTLQVVDQFKDDLEVHALVAGSNVDALSKQILVYHPKVAVLVNQELFPKLVQNVGNSRTKLLTGEEGMLEAVSLSEVDTVVAAISGFVGLKPTLEAIKLGKNIALANKETLVAAGQIVMREAAHQKVNLLPVDSEHSAIFQCMDNKIDLVESIIITASGGPFRGCKKEQLLTVKPETALKHPNWAMGAKITIDSATMVNKGLEVIEAHWLFNMPYENIEVVVHPQSIIHSLVKFRDGSLLAQMGLPDMRLPIQYALTWPTRWNNNWERLDLAKIGQLTFEKPNDASFPALKMAYEVGRIGGTAPCIYNAANEQAVQFFLDKQIGFLEITDLIRYCLDELEIVSDPTLEEIFEVDKIARQKVISKVNSLHN